jgi:hypothetical protein
MGEQAKANTTAGNAAFWRNSLNQIFMAAKGLGCYCSGFWRAARFHQIHIDTARSLSSCDADEENETN